MRLIPLARTSEFEFGASAARWTEKVGLPTQSEDQLQESRAVRARLPPLNLLLPGSNLQGQTPA
jgi:hypothetical protein